ncbi:UV damage repair protein UvrX [Virgibacillus sp. NKC19-3]|uniref:Y-family DNA polymerase n=1 Tax=Virgibacillus saliphilus TaxID=2831674 RepID=UPI001C9A8F52|nr:UV damage repair protein UvrX [Virgibacillus sp. NKC19-3]MBY7142611.1 UV damage repair protein UvrX [Virgibacillus sp. NKC19-3]
MNYSNYPRHDVLCIDVRSFYASVEAVRLGYDPMKVLLAVVGDPNRSGSIVLAASPALKKRYRLSNVSRFYEIPDDPEIVIVKARMGDYLKKSVEITKMLLHYVPIEALHQYSVDEVWITVDGLKGLFGDRLEIAKMIKRDIYRQFGLVCSIGIGDNKFLAKVVMDLYAKKSGIAICRYEDVEKKLWPVSIGEIWGIGSRMEKNLNRFGIYQLEQLAHFPLARLKNHYGVMGEQLYWHAWGIDLSPVEGDFFTNEQKNFGNGIALLRDYSGKEAETCILDLTEEVCRRARTAGKAGRTVHLSIVYSRETGGGFSRSKTIDYPTNVTMDVYDVCLALFHDFYDGYSYIRHINVSLGKLSDANAAEVQLSLFDDKSKQNDIGYVMDKIRDKYGPTAILRASSYTKAGVTLDRSKKIGGHYA